MQTWEWAVVIVILVGAVVFTLAWWKIADKWADKEHQRFGPSKPAPPENRVIIKFPPSGQDSANAPESQKQGSTTSQ